MAGLGAFDTFTKVINGDGTAPTLKNLASGGTKLGSEVDNATDKKQAADFVLKVRGASAFAANAPVQLYLVPATDGTNYEDGSDSVTPPPSQLVGTFAVRAVATQQRIAIRGVLLSPGKFKPLIRNGTAVGFTNTDNENELYIRKYNLQE